MRVVAGRVTDGKVDLVLAAEPDGIRLTPEEEAELTEAVAEIERDEFEDGFALLREIRAQAGR
jgi:hypothetical protein